MRTLFSFFFFLLAGALLAQTGTVRGKIIDDASGMELIGATVMLQDSEVGTVTDLDGTFTMELPVGVYTLQVSYISYATQLIEGVEVKPGDVTVMGEIHLSEELVEIATVVVSARAIQNNETAIQTLQRKGINTIDGISNQAFTLRGDGTAAAALKRVTGLSVEGGKYVYVRGLGDRYSKTTLNGANIPGLDPDKNTVQMDLFPSNLIDNILVYKNFTPDLPGDFSGGLINITTKDFPEDFTLQVRVGTGYNPNSNFNEKFLSYQGSSTDWLGFDNGARNFPSELQGGLPSPADVILAANLGNYEPSQKVTDATLAMNNILTPTAAAPFADHNFSLSLGNQTKLGGVAFGYMASMTYDHSYTGYAEGITGRYKNTSPTGNPESLNTERLLTDNRYSDAVLIGGMLSGSFKFNNSNRISLNLIRNQSGQSDARYQEGRVFGSSVDGAYQERTLAYEQRALSSGQIRGSHAIGGNKFKIDWSSSYTLSQMKQPDLRFVNNFVDTIGGLPVPIIDAAEDIPPTRFNRSMNENNWDNHLDLAYNFRQWSGQNASLKFGGAFLTKQREFRDTVYRYTNPNAGNVGDFSNYVTPKNVWASNPEQENTQGVFLQNFSEARNQYDSRMNVMAGYVMTELPLTQRLKSIFGVRVEKTDLFFTSFDPGKNLNDTKIIDNLDPLPSGALIYEVIKDKMNLRGSFSQTIARPTFREAAPVALFDVVSNAIIIGNPELERTLINNADFRWE
ncbi:MAG: carboxypeptidase-like regulatory domain-containing protein [Saprospirales bacterium]|nr:carboxypeptidase-like regulatory domain-containing protein [Saprospirales bacterium]